MFVHCEHCTTMNVCVTFTPLRPVIPFYWLGYSLDCCIKWAQHTMTEANETHCKVMMAGTQAASLSTLPFSKVLPLSFTSLKLAHHHTNSHHSNHWEKGSNRPTKPDIDTRKEKEGERNLTVCPTRFKNVRFGYLNCPLGNAMSF